MTSCLFSVCLMPVFPFLLFLICPSSIIWRKGFIQLTVPVHNPSVRKIGEGTGVGTMLESCLLAHVQLPFLYSPVLSAQRWCSPMPGPSHISLQSKQSLIDMATDQFNLDSSSVEIPFSQVTLGCVKLIIKANQQATPCQLNTQKYHHSAITFPFSFVPKISR